MEANMHHKQEPKSQSSFNNGKRPLQDSRHMNQGIDNNFDLSGSRSHNGMGVDDTYETDRGYRAEDNDMNSFSQSQEQRRVPNRSPYEPTYSRYSGNQRDRGVGLQGSSFERQGYPSNMNAWSGADRNYNSGRAESWSNPELESDTYSANRSVDNYDWELPHIQKQGHTGKGPKGYKRSDDRIKEEVCEILARNPRIDASDIEVEVSNAMVSLSGTVDSKEIRRAAEIAIENLSGVEDVKNEIRVRKETSIGAMSTSKPKGSIRN
jgi:osmotically-inducible protein OsmY